MTKWVCGIFKKSTFRSPTTIILSDSSYAFSMDQDKFLQKKLSQFGGRYVQQSKILQIGSLISTQMHSIFVGSKSMRLFTRSEFDIYTIIPPPKLFLSLRKIVLKPSINKSRSKMEEFKWDSVKHKTSKSETKLSKPSNLF